MVGIVVFSALSLLMAFLLGVVFRFDDGKDTEEIPWIYIICVLLIIFSVTQIVHKVGDYYDKKEYPLTEYDINKKTIVVEGNDSTKTDTVYFFVRKSNN